MSGIRPGDQLDQTRAHLEPHVPALAPARTIQPTLHRPFAVQVGRASCSRFGNAEQQSLPAQTRALAFAIAAAADASILRLVQALVLLNRSVHQFEATHPATTSDEIGLLLQQIRQSRSGPPPSAPPPAAPQPPTRRRNQCRQNGRRVP